MTSVRNAPPVAVGAPAYRGSWNSRSSAVTSRPSVRTSFTVKPGNESPALSSHRSVRAPLLLDTNPVSSPPKETTPNRVKRESSAS